MAVMLIDSAAIAAASGRSMGGINMEPEAAAFEMIASFSCYNLAGSSENLAGGMTGLAGGFAGRGFTHLVRMRGGR